jgi:putative flavoprotein involved in K+ transport
MRTLEQHVETVIVGGGQAGLSVGYQLARRGLPFVILDAGDRVGDSWRGRWDSLRLFTPARYDGLAGLPFPAPPHSYPTKDAMADYLESYATRFELPVRLGMQVDRVALNGTGFVVSAGERRLLADNVVVAVGSWQRPRVPDHAAGLHPAVVQLHAAAYRNADQLRDGDVLVVGAGNSGAEIALDAVRSGRRVWLSGPDVGHIPIRIESFAARFVLPLILRGLFHRVLTTRTPMGRRKRPEVFAHGLPLVRTKPEDLDAAGIERVPRVIGIRDGLPELEDGRVLDVANVLWCTGFGPGIDWLDIPGVAHDDPETERGVVPGQPGLYFVGQLFLYSVSSAMIHGLARDARHVARHIASRRRPATDASPPMSTSRESSTATSASAAT